jgi:hypothetical protein
VLPRWVVYHELVLTSKEFMRTVRLRDSTVECCVMSDGRGVHVVEAHAARCTFRGA